MPKAGMHFGIFFPNLARTFHCSALIGKRYVSVA